MSIFSSFSRRTVRLRLALLHGGLFLVSGAALLALAYLLDRPGAGQQLISSVGVLPGDGPIGQAGEPVLLSGVRHRMLLNFGLALVAMSAIAAALGWIVAGRILRPLQTITATVRDISATGLHRRLALPGPADELKDLGDSMDALLARLESALQAQQRFVANAAQALRGPLADQRELGRVALADLGAGAPALRVAHERILAAGARQEQLVEALLTLTRGPAGIEAHEPFDLGHLTGAVVAGRQAEAASRSVTVRTAISPALAAGHRGLAERLVANLVDNALRHNEPGGWVEVTTRTAAGRATLTVANGGPAVSPDGVEELFEPFSRAAKADGPGLGLPVVRAIAGAHDAAVTATARPEGGLTVEVAFPSVSSRLHALAPRPAGASAGDRGGEPGRAGC